MSGKSGERAVKYEAFLDDLAAILDGDEAALERHADFLADDDEARDLRYEAARVADEIAIAGADFVVPNDLEARVLAALDGGGRTTSPGFAVPDLSRADESELAQGNGASSEPMRASAAASGASAREQTRETYDMRTASVQAEAGRSIPSAEPERADSAADAPRARHAGASTYAGASTAATASEAGNHLAGSESTAGSDTRATVPLAAVPGGAPTSTRGARKPRSRVHLVLVPFIGVAALAAAALIGVAVWGGEDERVDTANAGTTATTGGIEGRLELIDRAADDGRSGVEVQRAGSEAFVALAANEAVPAGAVVRTDDRTRARLRLSDGSLIVLNHATSVELVRDRPRTVRLARGELVADVAHLEQGPRAMFHTPTGRVEVLGTKFELTATDEVTSVRVSRGAVSFAGASGQPAEVRAGEEGLARGGRAPEVAPVTNLAGELGWSELGGEESREDSREDSAIEGIGSLRARRPGEREDRERPLTLARHSVRVRIVGNVARTEIEEVFRNDGDQTLEGIYRFPLPPDAQIARLALDVEGRMEEGSFVERDRASRIWAGVIRNARGPITQRVDNEEFIWVPGPWRDPAILEWQRGGQFELRIFPIPAHGERRVVLAYTQTVAPQGGRRRYVYPLAHSADGSTQVGEFDVDVRVAGAQRVDAANYRVTSATEEDATRLRMNQRDFLPKGDLVVEYVLPGAERELTHWTYRGDAVSRPADHSREGDAEVVDLQRRMADDRRPYVAFALRPELPRASQRRDRDYVLVVDASQSMVGERYARAVDLASRVIAEMDRRDRFTVLACDYECRAAGGLRAPSAQGAREAKAWLDSIEAAGASDLTAIFRETVATVEAERREGREMQVMYFGDGTSTVGYRRPAPLAAEIRALADRAHVRFSTVGVGGDADTLALRAIARAGGGHYVPYVPGQRVSEAAVAILETSYGASLERPRIDVPAGITDVAPGELPTLRSGEEILIVGRMNQERVQGDVILRGSVAGAPFEQRYRVDLTPTEAAGNRFVPQLWAAAQIEELQLAGRGEDRARIVALSKGFGVMSRHTSLLVLESEAMFRAFGVDRRPDMQQWTGEEDVVAGGAEGSLAVVGESIGDLSGVGRGGGGTGLGLGGLAPGHAEARERASRPVTTRAAQAAPAMAGPAADSDDRMPAPAEASRGRGGAVDPWGGWSDMPTPGATPATTPPPPMVIPPQRRPLPGQWMRRVTVRIGEIDTQTSPTSSEIEAARRAQEALRANADSRDRHRDAVRALSRAGDLAEALRITNAWIERDRSDAEALTAKADVLGRMGRRDEALRLLTGTVDLSPNNEALHLRLANAFERVGRLERACAHRIALAEIDDSDPAALGGAMRCERSLGRQEAAQRLLSAAHEGDVRVRAEQIAGQDDDAARFRGDLTIEASWSGDEDLDLSLVTAQGTRLSWMGGRTAVVGENATARDRESLGLRFTTPGGYAIEVARTDPQRTGDVRGELRVRVLGTTRTIPFTLRGERAVVGRVRVTRETRLEPANRAVPAPW